METKKTQKWGYSRENANTSQEARTKWNWYNPDTTIINATLNGLLPETEQTKYGRYSGKNEYLIKWRKRTSESAKSRLIRKLKSQGAVPVWE